MLNKIGFNTESWGISKVISSHKLEDSLIYFLWFVWDRYLFTNFKAFRPKHCAFNTVINTSCGKESEAFERSINSTPNAWPLSTLCFHFLTLPTGSVVQYSPSKGTLRFRKKFIHKQGHLLTERLFKYFKGRCCISLFKDIWTLAFTYTKAEKVTNIVKKYLHFVWESLPKFHYSV